MFLQEGFGRIVLERKQEVESVDGFLQQCHWNHTCSFWRCEVADEADFVFVNRDLSECSVYVKVFHKIACPPNREPLGVDNKL